MSVYYNVAECQVRKHVEDFTALARKPPQPDLQTPTPIKVVKETRSGDAPPVRSWNI